MKMDHFISDNVIRLLKITHPEDTQLIENIGASELSSYLVNMTQQKWLRPAGKERWELKDSLLLSARRDEIIQLVEKLGFVQEIKPSRQEYDSVLLLGATDKNLLARIHYLKRLWDAGLRYRRVYLLTGNAKIKHSLTDFKALPSVIANNKLETEAELVIKVFKHIHSDTGIDPEVIQVIAIEKQHRPNTEDTLLAWLANKVKAKNLLIVSNQPFVLYQDSVTKRVLTPLYQLETVGDCMFSNTPIVVMLDAIARYLYECSFVVD